MMTAIRSSWIGLFSIFTSIICRDCNDIGQIKGDLDRPGEPAFLLKDINTKPASSSALAFAVLRDKAFVYVEGALWVTDGVGTMPVGFFAPQDPVTLDNHFCLFKDRLFYRPIEGVGDVEPWVSDGTLAGTRLFKDLNPEGGSYPQDFRVVGDHLFFGAFDGTTTGLWASDGTPEGTLLLKDNIYGWGGYYGPTDYIRSVLDDRVFFMAYEDISGQELWTSDGTPGGTYRLTDIDQNPDSWITPDNFTISNGRLFFTVYDSWTGEYGLWASDGTPAGTAFLMKIDPNQNWYYPYFMLTDVAGRLFFATYDDGTYGNELWVSDGTPDGTVLLKDLNPNGDSSPHNLTAVDGKLFFTAYDDDHGNELWMSDGTPDGTVLLKDLNPNGDSNPSNLTNVDGRLFFTAYDDDHGNELWVSDGTPAGTVLLKDINPNGDSSPSGFMMPGSLIIFGAIIFTANDGEHGTEPWVSDGTPGGTFLLKDLNPEGDTSTCFSIVDGRLFILAKIWKADGTRKDELWRSDGTSDGTVPMSTVLKQPEGWRVIDSPLKLGSQLLFCADDGGEAYGAELWSTDGTGAGTYMLRDFDAGNLSSWPGSLEEHWGTLFFHATSRYSRNDYDSYSSDIWTSDGTTQGTVSFRDLVGRPASWQVFTPMFEWKGRLYFPASDGSDSWDLWTSDKTPGGTYRVKEIQGRPFNLRIFKDRLLFFSSGKLWVSDGTEGGTLLLKVIDPSGGSDPYPIGEVNGRLFFTANDGVHGWELWVSDGTTDGTFLVKDINPDAGEPGIYNIGEFNGRLFFVAYDGVHGSEPWISDGTTDGTYLVKDINPSGDSGISYITELNGRLLFWAIDGVHGWEPWVSDGTTAGTYLVKDINPNGGSDAYPFMELNGRLLFWTNDGVHGWEPWVSDGTTDGTFLLKDINPSGDSGSSSFTELNGRLLFTANDGVHGWEPWVSDGTTDGTYLVKDIYPGGNQGISGLWGVVNGRLLFWANDGVHGLEPWASDGTPQGTYILGDLNPWAGDSNPTFLQTGGKIFIHAYDPVDGPSLWSSDGTPEGTRFLTSSVHTNSNVFTILKGNLVFDANDGERGYELWALPLKEEDRFLRGDSNGDGAVDISDPIHFLGFMYLGTARIHCADAADSNDDGILDITDPVATLSHLYLGVPDLPPPGAKACGPDPTGDELTCDAPGTCP